MKEEIIKQLPDNYKKLVVSCEQPKLLPYGVTLQNGDKYRFFEPCGDCDVCEKIIRNDYYGCQITRKNYSNAESIYNQNKYNSFKYKLF